jgi:hypothetical protein
MPLRRLFIVLCLAAGFGVLLSSLTRGENVGMRETMSLCDSGGARRCP